TRTVTHGGILSVGTDARLAEIYDRFPAAHSLDPNVLDARLIQIQIHRGDDHLCRERFVDSIALPIEVGLHDDGVVIGERGLLRLFRGPVALETGRGKGFREVPADPFAGLAPRERPLVYVLGVAKPSPALQEP